MIIETKYGNIDFDGGHLVSSLERQTCDHCGQPDCSSWDCGAGAQKDIEEEIAARLQYNGALGGIEALLLAMDCGDKSLAHGAASLLLPGMGPMIDDAICGMENHCFG